MKRFVNSLIHPDDTAAADLLRRVPGFDILTKKILDLGIEQMMYGTNLASKIKLSEKQKPQLFEKLRQICRLLDIKVPEFYLEMNPTPNAYTFGDERTCIVITSGLLETLSDNEIEAVLAHECGHIACNHVHYNTIARILSEGHDLLGIIGPFYLPIQYALMYWSRKSELSADRVSVLVAGKESVLNAQLRLTGGSEYVTNDISIEEWAKQVDSYNNICKGSKWDKMLQILAISGQDQPFATIRISELMKWCKTSNYKELYDKLHLKQVAELTLICPRCGALIKSSKGYCPYCSYKNFVNT